MTTWRNRRIFFWCAAPLTNADSNRKEKTRGPYHILIVIAVPISFAQVQRIAIGEKNQAQGNSSAVANPKHSVQLHLYSEMALGKIRICQFQQATRREKVFTDPNGNEALQKISPKLSLWHVMDILVRYRIWAFLHRWMIINTILYRHVKVFILFRFYSNLPYKTLLHRNKPNESQEQRRNNLKKFHCSDRQ